MIDINELRLLARRHAQVALSIPIKPQALSELLDRLEAAESDALEQARLNGIGASREAALMAKLEDAEKEVAHIKEVVFPRKMAAVAVGWETKCARLEQERDSLLSRIEAMERQEPVGTAFLCVQCNTPFDGEYYCPKCGGHTATKENVYVLPGAKGE